MMDAFAPTINEAYLEYASRLLQHHRLLSEGKDIADETAAVEDEMTELWELLDSVHAKACLGLAPILIGFVAAVPRLLLGRSRRTFPRKIEGLLRRQKTPPTGTRCCTSFAFVRLASRRSVRLRFAPKLGRRSASLKLLACSTILPHGWTRHTRKQCRRSRSRR